MNSWRKRREKKRNIILSSCLASTVKKKRLLKQNWSQMKGLNTNDHNTLRYVETLVTDRRRFSMQWGLFNIDNILILILIMNTFYDEQGQGLCMDCLTPCPNQTRHTIKSIFSMLIRESYCITSVRTWCKGEMFLSPAYPLARLGEWCTLSARVAQDCLVSPGECTGWGWWRRRIQPWLRNQNNLRWRQWAN